MSENFDWTEIDEALGLRSPDPELVESFRSAGFDDDAARRGARMLNSGRYFGFTDVAESLATAGGGVLSPIQKTKIATVAQRLEEQAGERNRTGTTPWGRPRVQESTDAWGRAREPQTPTVEDFQEVGLSEADAKSAAAGLAEGKFLSFEDACLATALFGGAKDVTLREAAMRTKAREFAQPRGR